MASEVFPLSRPGRSSSLEKAAVGRTGVSEQDILVVPGDPEKSRA